MKVKSTFYPDFISKTVDILLNSPLITKNCSNYRYLMHLYAVNSQEKCRKLRSSSKCEGWTGWMTGWEHSAVSEEKHRVFSGGLLCVVGACQHSAVLQQEHQLFTVCATLPPVGPCIPNTFYLHSTLVGWPDEINQSLNSKSYGWYYEQWNGWQGFMEFILRGEGGKNWTLSLWLF